LTDFAKILKDANRWTLKFQKVKNQRWWTANVLIMEKLRKYRQQLFDQLLARGVSSWSSRSNHPIKFQDFKNLR